MLKKSFVNIFWVYISISLICCSTDFLSTEFTPPKVTTKSSIEKSKLLNVNYSKTIDNLGLLRPTGIAIDAEKNIYITDAGNHRIFIFNKDWKKIDELGRFGWRLGEFNNPNEIAVHIGRNSALFIADSGNNRILTCFLDRQVFRLLTQVHLENPLGVDTDGKGNVYVADTDNNRILKLGENGSLLMERGEYGWAKNQFNTPTDLAVDKKGNIYIVDSGNKRVKRYDFSGNVSAVWNHSEFVVPYAICVDRFDNVFVTDLVNRAVYVFDEKGKLIIKFTNKRIQEPSSIAIKDDIVYITDASAGDIKLFRIVYSMGKRYQD